MPLNTESDYRRLDLLYRLAVRTKLYRQFKTLRGLYRTYLVASRHAPYDSSPDGAVPPSSWWDRYYGAVPVSDAATIEPGKEDLATRYHYNSVENLILAHLVNTGRHLAGARVLDVGSGAGHWLRFYRELGAETLTGIELSEPASRHLGNAFAADSAVEIIQGDVASISYSEQFDVVNAIGVIFHIVDDGRFRATVEALCRALAPDGLLFVGGHFGLIGNLNVQFDADGRVNKRLRSRRQWQRLLKGLEGVRVYRNRAYRRIHATLPENHVLVARKPRAIGEPQAK